MKCLFACCFIGALSACISNESLRSAAEQNAAMMADGSDSSTMNVCGRYGYEFGDRVVVGTGPLRIDNSILLVRDAAVLKLVSTLKNGQEIRIVAVPEPACKTDKEISATCVQAGSKRAYRFVRLMKPIEKCSEVIVD